MIEPVIMALLLGAWLEAGCSPALARTAGTSVLLRPLPSATDLGSSPPSVVVTNNGFLSTEAGPCPGNGYSRRLCQFSALDRTFAGPYDPSPSSNWTAFREHIAPYINAAASPYAEPLCTQSQQPSTQYLLATYAKPYEVFQRHFLSLYAAQNPGKTDFLPPAARSTNRYLGNRACPYGAGPSADRERKSFGHQMYFEGSSAVLETDNRINPYRWMSPLNEIHHHEQPSLWLQANADPVTTQQTRKILRQALNGDVSRRIIVYYDLIVTVDNLISGMNERSLDGFLAGSAGTDLYSMMRENYGAYLRRIGPANPEAAMMTRIWDTRNEQPSVQISLAMILQSTAAGWRDSEFLLASSNYLPTSTPSFAVVDDPAWWRFIPAGGNNGSAAWTRLAVNGITQDRVGTSTHAVMPIRYGGFKQPGQPGPDGSFYTIEGGKPIELYGAIDLTDYLRYSVSQGIYPGTGGVWGGVHHTTLGADGRLAASETPQVNSVAVIYEVQGPYKITIKVNQLDVRILPTPAGFPKPDYAAPIIGSIDGVSASGAVSYLTGWACAPGRFDAVRVDIYTRGASGEDRLLDRTPANLAADPAVTQTCQDPSASPHRFSYPLGHGTPLKGRGIFVYGMSPDNRPYLPLGHSGMYRMP